MLEDDRLISARAGYIVMSAMAGAMTALAAMKWKEMSWTDRLLTLFVGTGFGLIFVPWFVADIMHVDITPLRAACAITYIGAVGSNSLIPLALRWFRKRVGAEDDNA